MQQNESIGARERLSAKIDRLTSRVPAKVLAGSVQSARQWKDDAEHARRLAGSSRSKLPDLEAAVNRLEVWE